MAYLNKNVYVNNAEGPAASPHESAYLIVIDTTEGHCGVVKFGAPPAGTPSLLHSSSPWLLKHVQRHLPPCMNAAATGETSPLVHSNANVVQTGVTLRELVHPMQPVKLSW